MSFNSFKSILKDYFTFTNRERRPILLLLAIIIGLLFTLYYLRFTKVESHTDFTQFEKDIAAFEKRFTEDSIANEVEKPTYASAKFFELARFVGH